MSKKTIGSNLFLIDFFSILYFYSYYFGSQRFQEPKIIIVIITKLNSDARGNKQIINSMKI